MKRYFFIFIVLLYANVSFSQQKLEKSDFFLSPKIVVKTNVLYWLIATPNLGIETVLTDKLSLDLSINYNPWEFGEYTRFQHLLIQPELRYWIGKSMKGHFVGFNFYYLRVNVGFINAVTKWSYFSFLSNSRKEGNIFGGGASYGYNWRLSPQWSFETVASIGYAHLNYYTYNRDGLKRGNNNFYNYVGPVKLALNFVYIIK
jgi:hypothetical protein